MSALIDPLVCAGIGFITPLLATLALASEFDHRRPLPTSAGVGAVFVAVYAGSLFTAVWIHARGAAAAAVPNEAEQGQ